MPEPDSNRSGGLAKIVRLDGSVDWVDPKTIYRAQDASEYVRQVPHMPHMLETARKTAVPDVSSCGKSNARKERRLKIVRLDGSVEWIDATGGPWCTSHPTTMREVDTTRRDLRRISDPEMWPHVLGHREVIRYVDVPREVVKLIEKEVPKEVVKEVVIEVPKEVIKEVIKEVPKEVVHFVDREIIVEVPTEVIKEVAVEVVREVPREVIKEVSVPVPIEVVREVRYTERRTSPSHRCGPLVPHGTLSS